MTDRVNPSDIERIVGIERQPLLHFARAVSAEQQVYVLHSGHCLDQYGTDLRKCPFSLALDNGIEKHRWRGYEDRPVPVRLAVHRSRLRPIAWPHFAVRMQDIAARSPQSGEGEDL